MLKLELKSEGKTAKDLLLALDEARRMIADGITLTFGNSNGDNGGFSFFISGEEEVVENETEAG